MTLRDTCFWLHLRLAIFHRRRWKRHLAALLRLANDEHRPGVSPRSPAGSDRED